MENADITIGENGEPIDNSKSRQVHAGEQNISDNHTFVGENGNLVHEVTIADGSSAPKCTQEALKDHLGELASAKDENSEVNIKFDKPCDSEAIKSYNEFRKDMEVMIDDSGNQKYGNVHIHYPWDKE